MSALVAVEGVSRRFGSVVALDEVSLEIRANEFFALLGPSGCGKTTLLRILAGFEWPDSGRVTLDGADLLSIPPHRRPVNLMFQSYALFPHMSVERNVAYGLERENRPRDEIRDRVAEVLRITGIPETARRRPHQLSGGQRQRVALARAIIKRPRLLLLDEPLSALDRKVRAEMQLELKRLQHEVGITFVVVTHDQEEAMSMADRICVLDHGRVQQIDPPVELYHRPRTLFVARFVGTNNIFAGTAAPTGLECPGVGLLPAGEAMTPGRSAAPTAPVASDGASLPRGSSARLAVRPEHLRVVAREAAFLHGTVIDSTFYGGVSTLAVRVQGHPDPVLVTQQGVVTVERDSEVGLGWDPAQAVLLGETSAPSEAAASGAREDP